VRRILLARVFFVRSVARGKAVTKLLDAAGNATEAPRPLGHLLGDLTGPLYKPGRDLPCGAPRAREGGTPTAFLGARSRERAGRRH